VRGARVYIGLSNLVFRTLSRLPYRRLTPDMPVHWIDGGRRTPYNNARRYALANFLLLKSCGTDQTETDSQLCIFLVSSARRDLLGIYMCMLPIERLVVPFVAISYALLCPSMMQTILT
jgi:hypothetical protein